MYEHNKIYECRLEDTLEDIYNILNHYLCEFEFLSGGVVNLYHWKSGDEVRNITRMTYAAFKELYTMYPLLVLTHIHDEDVKAWLSKVESHLKSEIIIHDLSSKKDVGD